MEKLHEREITIFLDNFKSLNFLSQMVKIKIKYHKSIIKGLKKPLNQIENFARKQSFYHRLSPLTRQIPIKNCFGAYSFLLNFIVRFLNILQHQF